MTTFWASNKVEPKRAYRWVGYMNLFAPGRTSHFSPTPFLIKTFTKPTFTLDNETIINNFTSETEIVIKNYVWDDISITMYDVENAELNTSNAIYKWLVSLGYNAAPNTQNLSKLFTNLYDNNLELTLHHIDHNGTPIEEWSFINPQPTSINFGGELDYGSDEIMTITMGITYVAAEYKNKQRNETEESA